ncbi:MAG: cytochrome c-type biogenesis protein [Acidimicrobiia bacterium]
MTLRRGAWVLLGVLVAGAVVFAASQGGKVTPQARARDLAAEIQCPECDGVSVAQSLAPTSRAIRADLRRRIAAGESDDEIRQAYAERYGESILLRPESSGLGVLLWGLPIVLVIAGAATLVLASRRWRREPLLHATDADEALVDKARRT